MFKNAFSPLLYTDFEINNIEVYNISFCDSTEINYMLQGRSKFLLHLSLSGTRYYITENQAITVKPYTAVFIPDKTRYCTYAINTDDEACNGINICFDMKICDNKESWFKNMIYTETEQISQSIINEFKKINDLWIKSPFSVLRIKSSVYTLLCMLSTLCEKETKDYTVIKPAIDYITEHYKENMPIAFYAELCNLSESYFRKKFVHLMGIPPVAYRNELRFNEAKRLYLMNVSLEEIAENVGFYDASHLSKLYKIQKGSTLKNDTKFI